MQKYKEIEPVVAEVAITTQERHLWYLSEELAPLCIFSSSDKVSDYQKLEIAKKILKTKEHYDCKVLGQPTQPIITPRTRLVDLIGPQSWHLFSKFEDTQWLSKHPRTWEKDPGFNVMFRIIRNLKVVNDVAERGVKLATDFSDIITTDEEQMQYLLQVVEDSRLKLKINSLTKTNMKLGLRRSTVTH